MHETDFVSASVAHQFGQHGRHRFVQSPAARDHAMAKGSGTALAWDLARGVPYDCNDWRIAAPGDLGSLAMGRRGLRPPKPVGTLEMLMAAGADFDMLIDMQDRRMRQIVLEDGTDAGSVHPVFGFNRLADAPGRLLLPLPGYHDIASPDFLGAIDPGAVPWAAKSDRFAWRGIVGGRANPKNDVRQEGRRLRPVLRDLAKGRISADEAGAALRTFPRHRFVDRYLNDPRADVGFVDGNGFALAGEPALAGLARPRVTRPEFQTFKYLVVLRGLDIGSSFYWTMNSGSLGLVMDTPFQSFASVHFRPWVHYVPFAEDLSDFEERLGWCAANQDACETMVREAASVCRLLARADLRDGITRGLVAAVRDRLAEGAGGR